MPRATEMAVVAGRVARPLDFVVVGAAKSGTTTLFHLVKGHPELSMPPDKEAPFFSKDEVYLKGWDAYRDDVFAGAPADTRWGKITPRYLGDLHVPARMAEAMPDVRLLALLRHPVERAFSKYRLVRRTGSEAREFDQVVDEQLRPEHLARARTEFLPLRDTLVVRGEYARLLDGFLEHFPREALLARLTDDLEADPGAVVGDVLTHIGVDPHWRPASLDVRAYVGGDVARASGLTRRAARNPVLRAVWGRLPRDRRRSFAHWFSVEGSVRRGRRPGAGDGPTLSPETRARLVEHYRPDVARLEALLGREVPWADLR